LRSAAGEDGCYNFLSFPSNLMATVPCFSRGNSFQSGPILRADNMFRADATFRLYKGKTFLLGKGRARLLELILEERSINSAARRQGMSYRHAWAVLRKISGALGEEVVRSERGGSGGGGTVLTRAGKRLLEEYRCQEEGLRNYLRYGRRPALTVDGVIFREATVRGSNVGDTGDTGKQSAKRESDGLEVLLVRRGNPPFRGMHALPGGFVDYGEAVDEAVVREVREETGLITRVRHLVGVYSDPSRDPRGHTVSPVYLLETVGGELVAGDDAAEAAFFPVEQLPELAFDHGDIIRDALRCLQVGETDLCL